MRAVRVLILTSSTGGGHNMRARAIQAWAQACPEFGITAQLHRPLEESHGLYAFGVWLYNTIQRTAPFLHHIYYNVLEVIPFVSVGQPFGAEKFRAVLEQIRPDVLLSVHDSVNHDFFAYARTVLGRDRVKCVTYCGELHGGYGFSRYWVNPEADLFIGAVPETCAAAIKLGMSPAKVKVGGLLLRRFFYERPNLEPTEFNLLLSASSRGANNHVAFLDALKRANVDVPVTVLCGKSPAATARVAAWVKANPTRRVRVQPHNSDIGELMRTASAIVNRPGTGTTSEAILSGCPILLNCLGGIMPQERITVEFCRRHDIAYLVRKPSDLPKFVDAWRRDPAQLAAVRQRLHAACPPARPPDVLALIAGLMPDADALAAQRLQATTPATSPAVPVFSEL